MRHPRIAPAWTRREWLRRMGGGFGALGLAGVLADPTRAASPVEAAHPTALNPLAPRVPQFAPRAKRVIFLFMNGGPSHVDTFDPKPALNAYDGDKLPQEIKTGRNSNGTLMGTQFAFARHGQSGIEVSELYPEVARCIDEICVVRSMHTDVPNHEPALLMMNSGQIQPTRPSLGSWLTYGLGTENQNLPGFVVLCPGKPVVGPQLWSNSFLPGIYQGTHINNKTIDPKSIIAHLTNRSLARGPQRTQLDLLQQMNELHLADRPQDAQLEARIQSLEMAFRMQFEAQDVFDTEQVSPSRVPSSVTASGEFANACLIARRLAERGVRDHRKSTTATTSRGTITQNMASCTASTPRRAIARSRPCCTDLKATRPASRTRSSSGAASSAARRRRRARTRPRPSQRCGFSMWLAGGGVKRGLVHGATDEIGYRDAVEDQASTSTICTRRSCT